ncbi:class A beta-lactamase-related serine hydrolase [Nocardia yunnanensis]|uniref:Class A beta-lactamase-related serine hydrolase n=1 Tax=Nocardia yunnanensis TaxID=2382165 RepID=A0A386ZH78_9NOCA|nr:serine hydrolase domain-containing protein [Nocardia yunnanensis]AYF76750.1 class A beta-lactamase-related serine hydrolase [Nocardia yunnanensis]
MGADGIRVRCGLLVAVVAVAVAGCRGGGAAESGSADGGAGTVGQVADGGTVGRVSDAVAAAVRSGMPGAQVVLDGAEGRRVVSAGVGDLAGGVPYAEGAHFRIGSVTKSFVATVVLQLVAEGAVELDAPIARYLPGVVRGNGNDGERISVRQLLQHTSGLADFAPEDPSRKLPQQLDQTGDGKAYRDLGAAEVVGIAMSMPPQFEPGARFEYTNTNYVLLGMLIERLTGRTLADAIAGRILEPLALHDTYFPVAGDTSIRDPHPLGYRKVDGNWVDATDTEVAWAGAAGAMISTGADLNRFFAALVSGKLLAPAQLGQMEQTVPMEPSGEMNYGLGLIRLHLPCGPDGKDAKDVWGHAGTIPGFTTLAVATPRGTAATLSINTSETTDQFSAAAAVVGCAIA